MASQPPEYTPVMFGADLDFTDSGGDLADLSPDSRVERVLVAFSTLDQDLRVVRAALVASRTYGVRASA